MNLQEIHSAGVYWIDLTQERDKRWAVVNAAINLRVP